MFMATATWSPILESCLAQEQGKKVLSPAHQWLGDCVLLHAWHGEIQRERKGKHQGDRQRKKMEAKKFGSALKALHMKPARSAEGER